MTGVRIDRGVIARCDAAPSNKRVSFDAAQFSKCHGSGVALRFPRVARIRTDKSASEADRLGTLLALVETALPPRAAQAAGGAAG